MSCHKSLRWLMCSGPQGRVGRRGGGGGLVRYRLSSMVRIVKAIKFIIIVSEWWYQW